MKPKAPNKRNPKPNCKSGKVKERRVYDITLNSSELRGEKYQRFLVTLFISGQKEFKKQYSNCGNIWTD